MKSNSLLTYVLYGLLGLFILTAGYYACQKQKEKKEQAAREAAEMEETLRDMGYASEDTTAATGSSFSNKDSLSKSATTTKPTANTTNPTTTTTTKPTTTTTPATGTKTDTKEKSAPIAKVPIVKIPTSSPTTPDPKKVAKQSGSGAGRWVVRAGTFTYVEGARTRLEEVIKAGYPNAEISKTKEGMFAVIVFRSNDKEAANRAVEKLQTGNIDAAVFAQK
jgi:cytoskeletal protein RodZ